MDPPDEKNAVPNCQWSGKYIQGTQPKLLIFNEFWINGLHITGKGFDFEE